MRVHPQRESLWRELHARPYVRLTAPAHVLLLSFLGGAREDGWERDRADLERLRDGLGLASTYEAEKHRILAGDLPGKGRLAVCWERHSEFLRYTFYLYELAPDGGAFEPFGADLLEVLPPGWLEGLNTPPHVATRIAVAPHAQLPLSPEGLDALFEGHTVNGSRVMGGLADAWSCFRVHRDGCGRIVLAVREMSPRDLGRTVERLLDIEDFYHLVLLPLPLAREVKGKLAEAERRMVAEMEAVRAADTLAERRAVLDNLLGLAIDIEHLRAQVVERFGAAAAYFSLLESRFAELREEKTEHLLRLSQFVMRRVRPAAETYRGLSLRLDGFSERIERAAELLRTGIELSLGEQNQRLLASTERRSRLQLRLQTSLESLSVVVLSYYTLGLLAYALKGLKSAGLHLDVERIEGAALPLILGTIWAIVHAIRKKVSEGH